MEKKYLKIIIILIIIIIILYLFNNTEQFIVNNSETDLEAKAKAYKQYIDMEYEKHLKKYSTQINNIASFTPPYMSSLPNVSSLPHFDNETQTTINQLNLQKKLMNQYIENLKQKSDKEHDKVLDNNSNEKHYIGNNSNEKHMYSLN